MKDSIESGGHLWATAEILAVDSEMFGFPVGWLTLLDKPPGTAGESLRHWVEEHGSVLTGTAVGASSPLLLQLVQSLGFVCVDLAMTMTLTTVKRRPRSLRAGNVRLAVPEDHPGIEAIAGTAFDFGRYHRDTKFPHALADRRFAVWIRRSLQDPKPGMCFYVMGPPGNPSAFMFSEIDGPRARWHLGGVSRHASNGLLGPMLFAGVLDALEAAGVRSVVAKISAANTAVLNIYSALGFHAGQAEFTLHHHLQSSPHLNDQTE